MTISNNSCTYHLEKQMLAFPLRALMDLHESIGAAMPQFNSSTFLSRVHCISADIFLLMFLFSLQKYQGGV